MIEFTYDAEADAAYVYLTPRHPKRRVEETRVCQVSLDGSSIILAFDEDRKLIGIEILGARNVLQTDVVDQSETAER